MQHFLDCFTEQGNISRKTEYICGCIGWHTEDKVLLLRRKDLFSETEQKTQVLINNILQSDNPLQNKTSINFCNLHVLRLTGFVWHRKIFLRKLEFVNTLRISLQEKKKYLACFSWEITCKNDKFL